jgi:hypothetical protein
MLEPPKTPAFDGLTALILVMAPKVIGFCIPRLYVDV